MTEPRLFGRSGNEGTDALSKAASAVAAGLLAVIVEGEGMVVVEAAGKTLVHEVAVVDGGIAPAVPARSQGLGGEAVVIVDHACLQESRVCYM